MLLFESTDNIRYHAIPRQAIADLLALYRSGTVQVFDVLLLELPNVLNVLSAIAHEAWFDLSVSQGCDVNISGLVMLSDHGL